MHFGDDNGFALVPQAAGFFGQAEGFLSAEPLAVPKGSTKGCAPAFFHGSAQGDFFLIGINVFPI